MMTTIKTLFLNPSTLIRILTDLISRVLTMVLIVKIMEVSTFTMMIARLILIMAEEISSTKPTDRVSMKSSNHQKIKISSYTIIQVSPYKAKGITTRLLKLSIKNSRVAQK